MNGTTLRTVLLIAVALVAIVLYSAIFIVQQTQYALVLRFGDIAWRNYQGGDQALTGVPAPLPPARRSGRSKAYIIHRLVSANTVSPDQCPVMSKPPSEADYYALMTPEQAAARLREQPSTHYRQR